MLPLVAVLEHSRQLSRLHQRVQDDLLVGLWLRLTAVGLAWSTLHAPSCQLERGATPRGGYLSALDRGSLTSITMSCTSTGHSGRFVFFKTSQETRPSQRNAVTLAHTHV